VTIRHELWVALSGVRDPELDQPITELGFVSNCNVDPAGRARIRLRLPTYFCAPNFAYLMVGDAYEAAADVPGVTAVDVALIDHFAAEQINAGVAARAGFSTSFPGEAVSDDLDELRRTFVRKAFLAGQDRVGRALIADGYAVEQLLLLRLADVPQSPDFSRMVDRRRELGIPADPAAPFLVDEEGRPIDRERLPVHLGFARATRVSIDANAGLCRGLLATRYGTVAS